MGKTKNWLPVIAGLLLAFWMAPAVHAESLWNDRSMFAHAGTRVAFCAKEILKKEANVIVDTKDLTQIITKVF